VKLHADPQALRATYEASDPFPHIVIDGLFDDAELDAVLRDFPSPEQTRWMPFDNPREKDGLIPDPYFGGGGLHQIEPGGFLKVHADFNVHPKLKLDRPVNMLIYLNKDRPEEYGGHLELWDAALRGPRQRILPTFNRTVVFCTTDTSFHGHPHPLTSPPGVTQVGIAVLLHSGAAGVGAERAA
jgi:hypothetical protein